MSWLESALDYGIEERDFWDMTIAELTRKIDSAKRTLIRDQRIKATYDYVLADMIGRSVARIYSSTAEYPAIGTFYPTLFDNTEVQEKEVEKQDNLSAARFRQFAESHNKKIREGSKVK